MSVVVSLQSKVCSKCKEVKLLSEFNKHCLAKDGRQNRCIACHKKVCGKCGEVKTLDGFSKRKNRKSGYRSDCKACVKEYDANYRAANPEETLNIVQQILKDKLHMSGKGKGVVYILRDAANKALKIGFTIKLNNRLKQHQTSNPFLTLVDIIPNVTISLEGTMHSKLIFHRIPGTTEWYRDDAQVLSLFADYKIKCKLESDLIS